MWRLPMSNTILVVDDQPELRLLIRLSLLSLGRVATAASGAEMMAIVRCDPPQLIVLDVSLGVESGLMLCRALKADPATRSIRVMLLSAHGQRAEVDAGMQAGADHYMIKPFSPRELVEAAAALLSDQIQ